MRREILPVAPAGAVAELDLVRCNRRNERKNSTRRFPDHLLSVRDDRCIDLFNAASYTRPCPSSFGSLRRACFCTGISVWHFGFLDATSEASEHVTSNQTLQLTAGRCDDQLKFDETDCRCYERSLPRQQ